MTARTRIPRTWLELSPDDLEAFAWDYDLSIGVDSALSVKVVEHQGSTYWAPLAEVSA